MYIYIIHAHACACLSHMRVCVTLFITTVAVGVWDPDFSKPLMTAVNCCTFELTMDCSCWVVTMYSLAPEQKLSSRPPQWLYSPTAQQHKWLDQWSAGSSMCWVDTPQAPQCSTMLHNAPQVKLWLSKFFEVDFVEELPGTLRRPETSKQEMAWAAWVQRSATSKHTQRLSTHFITFRDISTQIWWDHDGWLSFQRMMLLKWFSFSLFLTVL